MVNIVKYSANGYKRRIVFCGDKVISAIHLREDTYNVGDLYLGKVVSKSTNGYFVNTSDFNAFTNDKNLNIGENYIFEILKITEDKKPLVTSSYAIQSNSLILTGEKRFSKNIDEETAQRLSTLDINAFFKTEAIAYSNKELMAEYESLLSIKDYIEQKATFEKSLIKLHTVDFKECRDEYFIREMEEKIKSFGKREVVTSKFRLHIEKTKVGLIIDVDSLSSKESIEEINKNAAAKILEILILMNVSGIVLIDFISNGVGVDRDIFRKEKRITYIKMSKNGICEIIRKSVGINLIS